jgi:hypothetical protein
MRIRYIELVDEMTGEKTGLLKSSKVFPHPTNGAQFFIVLNPSTFEFKVFDAVAGTEVGSVVEGQGKSSHKMKLLAKNTLSRLGIEFEKESRPGKDISENNSESV